MRILQNAGLVFVGSDDVHPATIRDGRPTRIIPRPAADEPRK
jgi:hypothetical protein